MVGVDRRWLSPVLRYVGGSACATSDSIFSCEHGNMPINSCLFNAQTPNYEIPPYYWKLPVQLEVLDSVTVHC